MRVALFAAECAPVAKAGGLGDFVHGLGRALLAEGAEVEVWLPDYDCLRHDLIEDRHLLAEGFEFPFSGRTLRCSIVAGRVDGLACRFVAPQASEGFFSRGRIYGEPDDALRFACYSRAALEYLQQSQRWPDILHCNDWQTGLVPVLLYELYEARGVARTRVCYSLHNLGHQGWTDPAILHRVGLDAARLMRPDRLQDVSHADTANLMKGGIVFSNFVTTVSPRYAWEVLRTDQGMGLQSVLAGKRDRFAGVLNGIDQRTWDPGTDPLIAHPFSMEHLEGKAANKAALRTDLGMSQAEKPLLAVVSRLDRQKGVPLIAHGIDFGLARGSQVVLLGSALDPEIQQRFDRLRTRYLDHPDCHLELGYDERLAHRIYAAADAILIPSLYEPCGLTQMIGMRYGCVPVVRRVGGLADTVFDANFCGLPTSERNGFVFDEASTADLEFALERALGLWFQHHRAFRRLQLNGMRTDFSWRESARRYLQIFADLLVS